MKRTRESYLETVSNGGSHKSSGDSAVNTSTDGTENQGAVTNELADTSNLELDKVAHNPVGLSATDVNAEVAEDVGSAGGLDSNVRRGLS